jgi:hypothetical protein
MPSVIIDPDKIPGLREAEAKEHAFRAIPIFSDTVPLCGFWVRILTPRLHAELHFAGNAFLCSGVPSIKAALHFIWRLHPDYAPTFCGLRGPLRFFTWLKIHRALLKMGLEKAHAEIAEYLEFCAASRVRSAGANDEPTRERSLVHWAIANAAFFQAEMGIPFHEYLDTPMPIIDQQYRAYLMRNGGSGRIWQLSDQIFNQYATELLNPGE